MITNISNKDPQHLVFVFARWVWVVRAAQASQGMLQRARPCQKVTHNVTQLYGSLEYPDHPTTFSAVEADRI